MEYKEIKETLRLYIMLSYDVRPSLAEKAIEQAFKTIVDVISLDRGGDNDKSDRNK